MSSKPAVDNSWHERGEFPPVGCECEVKDGGEWRKTFIVGFDDDGYCVYTTTWNSLARDYDGDINQYNFRQLRTEREKMQKQSAQPAQDNSWYESGELPPVGVPVEIWWGGSFAYDCEFISKRGNNYVMWNLDADRADSADYMNSEFRPLRTEREKAIDEMVSVILEYDGYMIASATAEIVARQLYDSGYHK